ncbi:MAG: sensor histidine kinase [Sporomusaceae bacterium]|nr:sensor histidine kinase [Sporomusaceae bacterium]
MISAAEDVIFLGKKWLWLFLMILVVPLAGELQFHPFDGVFGTFRVCLGSPAFLFFLLWTQRQAYFLAGFTAGAAVLVFRITLDWLVSGAGLSQTFMIHFPAFFYYVTYSAVFYGVRIKHFYNRPAWIGCVAIAAEMTASIVELLFTLHYPISQVAITWPVVGKILLIAVIRSFFVLSFFFIMKLHQAEFMAEQQKEQNEHMLLLVASLYKELIHLTKSQQNAELVTKDCYQLYQSLENNQNSLNPSALAQKLLEIAGQVHDIKKDNQRIYASLTRLIADGEVKEYMAAPDLADMIIQSHIKYSRSLNKEIQFELQVTPSLPQLHVYTILSLVNNLVSNAVEAIETAGVVRINFEQVEGTLKIQITDNGPAITARKQKLIFQPGYTTKFDQAGNPSTGMGLPYVKYLTNQLQGDILLKDLRDRGEKAFIITLPLRNLTQGG